MSGCARVRRRSERTSRTGAGRGAPAAHGFTAPRAQPGQVLLIACGALAREITALTRANGWDHLVLRCLPAKLHLLPDRIPGAVREAIGVGRAAGFESIFVAYADCGAGGTLDEVCAEEGVARMAGPHCYSFFDGNAAFAARGDDEMRVFYLTDFLVRQFDAFVWRPMGLDRHPELRDLLFGHYDALVHLAQTEDAALDRKAREAAARLGLAHRRRFTGYGDLEAALHGL